MNNLYYISIVFKGYRRAHSVSKWKVCQKSCPTILCCVNRIIHCESNKMEDSICQELTLCMLGNFHDFLLSERFPRIYAISIIITQLSIYGVIVCFSLSHGSLNYCPGNSFGYILTGTIPWPVFPLRCQKTRRRLSTCATKMRIWFVYARRYYVTMTEMRHVLMALNYNNFIVYDQKHKVWYSFY